MKENKPDRLQQVMFLIDDASLYIIIEHVISFFRLVYAICEAFMRRHNSISRLCKKDITFPFAF